MLPRIRSLVNTTSAGPPVVPAPSGGNLLRRVDITTHTDTPTVTLLPTTHRLVDINHRSESQMVASMVYAEEKKNRIHPRVLVLRHDQALSMARERGRDPTITALQINRGLDCLYITDTETEVWCDGKDCSAFG